MLEWFIEKGVECVEGDVYSDNVPSLKLFKKLGFEEIFKGLRFTVNRAVITAYFSIMSTNFSG